MGEGEKTHTHKGTQCYSAKYNELNQLIEVREEEDRMIEYINGLPEEYRIKAMEKNHATLVEAVTSSTTIYNARQANRAQMKGISSIQNMDASNDYAFDTQSTSSSSSSSSSSAAGMDSLYSHSSGEPQRQTSLHEQISQLTAMVTQFSRGGYRGGYRGGRPRGRGGNENADGARSRSASGGGSRVSQDVYNKRKEGFLCFECGSADHLIGRCPIKKKKQQDNLKKKEEEK